jgi:hypothetical protein
MRALRNIMTGCSHHRARLLRVKLWLVLVTFTPRGRQDAIFQQVRFLVVLGTT